MNDYFKLYRAMLWLPLDCLLYWQAILTNWPLSLALYTTWEKAVTQLAQCVD